ncbi:hypothetical protein ABLN67_10900, partial [Mycobacterium tuberculosis]
VLRSVIKMGVFNRFIYRRNGVFAFIVKRFRVFRAPLQCASCAPRCQSPMKYSLPPNAGPASVVNRWAL